MKSEEREDIRGEEAELETELGNIVLVYEPGYWNMNEVVSKQCSNPSCIHVW